MAIFLVQDINFCFLDDNKIINILKMLWSHSKVVTDEFGHYTDGKGSNGHVRCKVPALQRYDGSFTVFLKTNTWNIHL